MLQLNLLSDFKKKKKIKKGYWLNYISCQTNKFQGQDWGKFLQIFFNHKGITDVLNPSLHTLP